MNPTQVRLSKHFLLSDFLGNHTVYTTGIPNMMSPYDVQLPLKMSNARALCNHLLEPIVEAQGPISISYGYISPDTSRAIVKYQDPNIPSHHRFDLGAAADICVHNWVDRDREDDTVDTSPILLAHTIDVMGLPYSRMITYSESPFICIAARADELKDGGPGPRNAFYENRYMGVAKPFYRSLATPQARAKALEALEKVGLPEGWRGRGHPGYHGGGKKQLHHHRVSKYCMLSDFLFDLQSIANGAKNVPNIANDALWNAFCAAGEAYDYFVDQFGYKRLSIIAGYVNPANPFYDPDKSWRDGLAHFTVVPPETKRGVVDGHWSGSWPSNIDVSLGQDGEIHVKVKV